MRLTSLHELSFGLFRLLMLGTLGLFIVYMHPSLPERPFVGRALQANRLDEERQTLWVRADSLQQLVQRIANREPGVFSQTLTRSNWEVVGTDSRAFDRIFLDGEPLTNWASLENRLIEPNDKGYGFSAPIIRKNKINYVHLPAEIIHSLQLYITD